MPEPDEHGRAGQLERDERDLGGRDERRDPRDREQRPGDDADRVAGDRAHARPPAAAHRAADDHRGRRAGRDRHQRRDRKEGPEHASRINLHARAIDPFPATHRVAGRRRASSEYEGVSRMKRAAGMLAAVGGDRGVCGAVDRARPIRSSISAVAQLNDLGIGTLTGMPSGRTTYRTTDEFNAELDALAAAYPTQVGGQGSALQEHPGPHDQVHRDHQQRRRGRRRQAGVLQHGRDPRQRDAGRRGQPRVRLRRAAAGQDQPEGRRAAGQGPADRPAADQPRRPRVQERGRATPPRAARAAARSRDRPARHVHATGVDLNRNYPFGWGSNIGVSLAAARQRPGLRARGQEHDGHRVRATRS